MTPERRIELLGLVDELAKELKDLPIPYQDGSESKVVGLPKAYLGQVTGRLEAGDSLSEVKDFVEQLAKLDQMVAQNSKNPQAPYRALQQVLQDWFGEQPGLTSAEWLYLLGWVRRRLPVKSREFSETEGGRSSSKENTTTRQIAPAAALGNPMKARLAELKKRMEGKA